MIISDTSFIVDLIRKKREALAKLSEIEQRGEIMGTTSMNILELYKGAYQSARTASNLECVRKIIEALLVIPISDETYEIFGSLSAKLSSQGQTMGDFEEVIASIALAHDASIVTRDEHFGRVSALKIMSY
jgi:tRNA(fMet)-specific endonuclease VapC